MELRKSSDIMWFRSSLMRVRARTSKTVSRNVKRQRNVNFTQVYHSHETHRLFNRHVSS